MIVIMGTLHPGVLYYTYSALQLILARLKSGNLFKSTSSYPMVAGLHTVARLHGSMVGI